MRSKVLLKPIDKATLNIHNQGPTDEFFIKNKRIFSKFDNKTVPIEPLFPENALFIEKTDDYLCDNIIQKEVKHKGVQVNIRDTSLKFVWYYDEEPKDIPQPETAEDKVTAETVMALYEKLLSQQQRKSDEITQNYYYIEEIIQGILGGIGSMAVYGLYF